MNSINAAPISSAFSDMQSILSANRPNMNWNPNNAFANDLRRTARNNARYFFRNHLPGDQGLSRSQLYKKYMDEAGNIINGGQIHGEAAEDLFYYAAKRGFGDVVIRLGEAGVGSTEGSTIRYLALDGAISNGDSNLVLYLTKKFSIMPDSANLETAFAKGHWKLGKEMIETFRMHPTQNVMRQALNTGIYDAVKYLDSIHPSLLLRDLDSINRVKKTSTEYHYYRLLDFVAEKIRYKPGKDELSNALTWSDDFSKYLMERYNMQPDRQALINSLVIYKKDTILPNFGLTRSESFDMFNYIAKNYPVTVDDSLIHGLTDESHYKGLVYLVKTKNLHPDKIFLDKLALEGNLDSFKFVLENDKNLIPDKKTLDSAFYGENSVLADLIIKNYGIKPDDRTRSAARLYKKRYYRSIDDATRWTEFINGISEEYGLDLPSDRNLSPNLSPEDQNLWDELGIQHAKPQGSLEIWPYNMVSSSSFGNFF